MEKSFFYVSHVCTVQRSFSHGINRAESGDRQHLCMLTICKTRSQRAYSVNHIWSLEQIDTDCHAITGK